MTTATDTAMSVLYRIGPAWADSSTPPDHPAVAFVAGLIDKRTAQVLRELAGTLKCNEDIAAAYAKANELDPPVPAGRPLRTMGSRGVRPTLEIRWVHS